MACGEGRRVVLDRHFGRTEAIDLSCTDDSCWVGQPHKRLVEGNSLTADSVGTHCAGNDIVTVVFADTQVKDTGS